MGNPRKYLKDVHTFREYENMHRCDRETYVPYWITPWYKLPRGLKMTMEEFNDKENSEWGKLDRFLRKNYPLQFFLREGYREMLLYRAILSFKWDLEGFYDDIKYWLFPRRPLLKNAVPNQWMDLDGIYTQVLYAGILEFVENEKGLERVLWEDDIPNTKNVAAKKMIEEIYEWAKTGRAELQKEISQSYPPMGCKLPYKEAYGKLDKLEKKLEAQDTRYLTWIVTNRELLWT